MTDRDRSSEVAANRELKQRWSSALVNPRIHGVNKVASGAIAESCRGSDEPARSRKAPLNSVNSALWQNARVVE